MKTIFIAELGSNHNQNYHRAIDLIDSAKACGFDKVKFQLYTKDTLYAPGYAPENLIEFPVEWIPGLYKHCLNKEIEIGYSIFHESFIEKAVNYCHFLKISSWDVLRLGLIKSCLDTYKPFMISLGGASIEELKNIRKLLSGYQFKIPIVLFHCIPKYPCKVEECNLNLISVLEKYFNDYGIGWSDHSNDFTVIYVALAKGANLIELHFDLDDYKGNETKYGHVWSPTRASALINNIKESNLFFLGNTLYNNEKTFSKERLQRADPKDGLRPMRIMRNDKTGTDKEEV